MSQTHPRPSPRTTATTPLRTESTNANSETSNSARRFSRPESGRSDSHPDEVNQNMATPRSVASSRSSGPVSSSLYSNSKLPPVNTSVLASREQPRSGRSSSYTSPSIFTAPNNTHSAPTPRRSMVAMLALKDKELRAVGNANVPPTPLDRASLYPTASPRTSIQANSQSQTLSSHSSLEKESNEVPLVTLLESSTNAVSTSNRKYESGLVTMSARSVGNNASAPVFGLTTTLKSCADTNPDLILSSPFPTVTSSTFEESDPAQLQTKFQKNIYSAVIQTQAVTCVQQQQQQEQEQTPRKSVEISPFDQASSVDSDDDDLVDTSLLHEPTQNAQNAVKESNEHERKSSSLMSGTVSVQQEQNHELKEEKNQELLDYGFADISEHNDSISQFPTESMEKYRKDILSSYKYFETNNDKDDVENDSNNIILQSIQCSERDELTPGKASDDGTGEASDSFEVSKNLNICNALMKDSEHSQALETSTLHLNFRPLANGNGDLGAGKNSHFPEFPEDSYFDETGDSSRQIMPFLEESNAGSIVYEGNNPAHGTAALEGLSSTTFASPQKQYPVHSLETSHLQTPTPRHRETLTTLSSSAQPVASMHRSPIEIHANFDLDCSFNDSLNSFIIPQPGLELTRPFKNTTKSDDNDDNNDGNNGNRAFEGEIDISEDKPSGLVGIPELEFEKERNGEGVELNISRNLSHNEEGCSHVVCDEDESNKSILGNRKDHSFSLSCSDEASHHAVLTAEKSYSHHTGFTMILDGVSSPHDENNDNVDNDDVFMFEDANLSRIEHKPLSHSLTTPKDMVAQNLLGGSGEVYSIDCDTFAYSSDQETTDRGPSSTNLSSNSIPIDKTFDPSLSLRGFASPRSTPNSGRYGNVKASPSANISFHTRLNSLNSTNTSTSITSAEMDDSPHEEVSRKKNNESDESEIGDEKNVGANPSLLDTSINTSLNTSLDDFADLHRVFHKLEQLDAINAHNPLSSLDESKHDRSFSSDASLCDTLNTSRSETVLPPTQHLSPTHEEQYQQELAHERNLRRIRDHRTSYPSRPSRPSRAVECDSKQKDVDDNDSGIYTSTSTTKPLFERSSPSQLLRRSSSLHAPTTPRSHVAARTQWAKSPQVVASANALTPRTNLNTLDTPSLSSLSTSSAPRASGGICSSDWVKIPLTILLTLLIGFYALQKYAEHQMIHAARDRYRDVY